MLDDLVRAFAESRNTAYKGVVRPVEGTILTVSKDIAKAAEEAQAQTDDLIVILQAIVKAADISVVNTPNLLPILKQAGVVDSGGKGLYVILEGLLRFCHQLSLWIWMNHQKMAALRHLRRSEDRRFE